jgi:hypothetical protein
MEIGKTINNLISTSVSESESSILTSLFHSVSTATQPSVRRLIAVLIVSSVRRSTNLI